MFRKLLEVLRMNRQYFVLSVVLLGGSGLTGYVMAEQIDAVVQEVMKSLLEKVEEISENPTVTNMFWIIFKNNVMAALSMLALGIFFGIIPVMALIQNGMVIGYFLNKAEAADINPFQVLVFGILPHGVIELFAILLATTIGIKYGTFAFRLVGSLFRTHRQSRLKEDFLKHVQYLPYMVVVIVAMLFVAAVIETTVTPLLVNQILGDIQLFGE
ncbi:MAG: stage II sporulation protein M [Bacillaceae bacterium]|nr:stage II sporulation protein M [Bacillaceae bacterium]